MPKIALEMLLLRMAQLPKLESIDALLDRMSTIELSLREGQGGADCVLSESRPVFEKKPLSAPSSPPVRDRPAALGRERPEAINVMAPPSDLVSDPVPVPSPPVAIDHSGLLPPPGGGSEPSTESDSAGAAPEDQEPDSPLSVSKAVENWQIFVNFLENSNPILWAKVSHCAVRVSGESIELEVSEMFEKSAKDPEFIQQFEDASQAFFGVRFQWVIMSKPARGPRGAGC